VVPLTEETIAIAYQVLFNREASREEISQVAKQHDRVETLRVAFLRSEEFQKKFQRLQEQIEAELPPTLIHIHIPKTAGTTIVYALKEQKAMQPSFEVHDDRLGNVLELPRQQRRRLRYIHGHLSIGLGDAMGVPFRYLAVLRQPGQRIFSFYQFLARTRTHPDHSLLRDNNMSFGSFLEFAMTSRNHRLEMDNGQMRRLAGKLDKSVLGEEPAILKRAIHNALSPKMTLGFVEHLEGLYSRLREDGLLDDDEPEALNVSPNSEAFQVAMEELNEEQKGLFERFTMWDQYLYDVCRSIVDPADD